MDVLDSLVRSFLSVRVRLINLFIYLILFFLDCLCNTHSSADPSFRLQIYLSASHVLQSFLIIKGCHSLLSEFT